MTSRAQPELTPHVNDLTDSTQLADSMHLADCGAPPSLPDIEAAEQRIAPHAHRTPVMTCASLDEMAGASLFFKCENLQKTGAFKFRGACNAVFSLSDDELRRGVATHSSGNHGAALALAARTRGSQAIVVMPSNSAAVKRAAVAHYGAEIIECDPTEASRQSSLDDIVRNRGCVVIHPFDDPRIIAGQGTAALELLDEVADLDLVIAPVGGGGLLSGTAIAVTERSPSTRVIGAEPAAADDTYRSMAAGEIVPVGHPDTIADGLRTTVGRLTFPVIRERVECIATVSEHEIVAAMRATWERAKILVEPSAAVPVAALLSRRLEIPRLEIRRRGQRIGVILSGGNVDLGRLPFSDAAGNVE